MLDSEAYYPGAVPRVSAFLENGTLDFPGFRRALARSTELAQGRLALAAAVARAAHSWPPLETFANEGARQQLLQVAGSSLAQVARECAELATVHPGANKDLTAARQLVLAQLKAIGGKSTSPANPMANLLHRYAIAHARWLSAQGVQGAEANAADTQQQLAATYAEVRQAKDALAAATAAVQSSPSADPVLRAEQVAWVVALGGAVPRSL